MGGSGPCPMDGTPPDLHERSLVPEVRFPWAGDRVGGEPRPGEWVPSVALGTGVSACLAAARVGGGRDGLRGANRPAFRDRAPAPCPRTARFSNRLTPVARNATTPFGL
jgi:hypothetical protein